MFLSLFKQMYFGMINKFQQISSKSTTAVDAKTNAVVGLLHISMLPEDILELIYDYVNQYNQEQSQLFLNSGTESSVWLCKYPSYLYSPYNVPIKVFDQYAELKDYTIINQIMYAQAKGKYPFESDPKFPNMHEYRDEYWSDLNEDFDEAYVLEIKGKEGLDKFRNEYNEGQSDLFRRKALAESKLPSKSEYIELMNSKLINTVMENPTKSNIIKLIVNDKKLIIKHDINKLKIKKFVIKTLEEIFNTIDEIEHHHHHYSETIDMVPE